MSGLRDLTWRERWTGLGGAATLAASQIAIRFAPMRVVARCAGLVEGQLSTTMPTAGDLVQAAVIGRVIRGAARRVPWESTCLAQAVAGAWLLRRRGVHGTVHLGVAKADGGRRMTAHAWLTCGSLVLTGEAERRRYLPVVAYSSRPSS